MTRDFGVLGRLPVMRRHRDHRPVAPPGRGQRLVHDGGRDLGIRAGVRSRGYRRARHRGDLGPGARLPAQAGRPNGKRCPGVAPAAWAAFEDGRPGAPIAHPRPSAIRAARARRLRRCSARRRRAFLCRQPHRHPVAPSRSRRSRRGRHRAQADSSDPRPSGHRLRAEGGEHRAVGARERRRPGIACSTPRRTALDLGEAEQAVPRPSSPGRPAPPAPQATSWPKRRRRRQPMFDRPACLGRRVKPCRRPDRARPPQPATAFSSVA